MADSLAPDLLEINANAGAYFVHFDTRPVSCEISPLKKRAHFIIDRNVANLYAEPLSDVIGSDSVLIVEATECAKTLDRFPDYIDHLVSNKVRRGDVLVAIGGGIVQDITCFLSATLLRGVDWVFYPTTLLAQADSCIGSKSSINSGSTKNILGTFTPPRSIVLNTSFLETLTAVEIQSGIGEMVKVHLIEGLEEFRDLARNYDNLLVGSQCMLRFIKSSLNIKKKIIEADEFDRGRRNILNYGHSFGHAIEASTEFKIPHGIAVTIGMDLANFVSMRCGLLAESLFEEIHVTLARNYAGHEATVVPLDPFFSALSKDKKNSRDHLVLVIPDSQGRPKMVERLNDSSFRDVCSEYLSYRRPSPK